MQSSRNAQIYSANVFLKKKPVEELVNKTLVSIISLDK